MKHQRKMTQHYLLTENDLAFVLERKQSMAFLPTNTSKYFSSWHEFSSFPWTIRCSVIKPQHLPPLTYLTFAHGLRWTVRVLAPRSSIRDSKQISIYKAFAPGYPW